MRNNKLFRSGMDIAWVALLSVYILMGATLVPFHGDESSKIYVGRDYYYIFLQGDLAKIKLDTKRSASADEYRANLASGTISNMIYGWLAANNGFAIEDLNDDWHWGQSYEWNSENNRVPDAQLLWQARLASSVQLALAAALFFVFAKRSINRPTAYVASLLYALHPSVLLNGRRAMQEGSHALGLMMILLTALWLIRQRKLWQYALFGICAGLAISAKHSNIFSTATIFLANAGVSIYEAARSMGAPRQELRWLLGLVVAALLMLLVFALLNPGWWDAPLETAAAVMSERGDLLERQAGVYGGYESLGQEVKGFFRFVFMGETQYYEDNLWAGYAKISEQIEAYEASGWAGVTIGANLLAGLVMLSLSVFGVVHLVRNREIPVTNRAWLLIWGGGIALIIFAVTPLPWARYYLPVLPFVVLMAGYTIVTVLPLLWIGIKKRVYGIAVLD